jgi:hypothetical protein
LQKRVLVLCLASGARWRHARDGTASARAGSDRSRINTRELLTPLGLDVLAALIKQPLEEQGG